jgi:hypothetical protein
MDVHSIVGDVWRCLECADDDRSMNILYLYLTYVCLCVCPATGIVCPSTVTIVPSV